MLITPPHHSLALWFIFLWRSIDFLLFSLLLIPGSVSSVALYRGAIIQGLITAPLAAYLLPGDSLFKPLPNDLGKLTCSTSQGCRAPLMSEGVAPTQRLLVLPKKKREAWKGLAKNTNASHIHISTHLLPSSSPHAGDKVKPSVQEDSSKGLRLRGTLSILIKISSEDEFLEGSVIVYLDWVDISHTFTGNLRMCVCVCLCVCIKQ